MSDSHRRQPTETIGPITDGATEPICTLTGLSNQSGTANFRIFNQGPGVAHIQAKGSTLDSASQIQPNQFANETDKEFPQGIPDCKAVGGAVTLLVDTEIDGAGY